jgi:hypothetical protein
MPAHPLEFTIALHQWTISVNAPSIVAADFGIID